ncbi:MAG: fumarate hydratase [Spirochaetes bacterium]|nr:fumarate hydratase [Spirochaetota bacterium]
MRTISHEELYTAVSNLVVQANFNLPDHVYQALSTMHSSEKKPLAKETLHILLQNATIAATKHIPLCQDCGSVIVFLQIGTGVTIDGNPEEIINTAVADTYRSHYLRSSIVKDPLFDRTNTGTNTPVFIHTDIVEGDSLAITVYIKGGGSENMSSLSMFTPTADIEQIIDYIVATVKQAGPNPCPPLFLGIGIGGTADVAMLNAKKAVLQKEPHPNEEYRRLEEVILQRCNTTGVGPLGFGGNNTVATVRIKEATTHIATLPVSLNLNCHSLRYRSTIL